MTHLTELQAEIAGIKREIETLQRVLDRLTSYADLVKPRESIPDLRSRYTPTPSPAVEAPSPKAPAPQPGGRVSPKVLEVLRAVQRCQPCRYTDIVHAMGGPAASGAIHKAKLIGMTRNPMNGLWSLSEAGIDILSRAEETSSSTPTSPSPAPASRSTGADFPSHV